MKKITFIFATILLLGFTSCDLIGNIDDIKQENVLTDQTLITDAQSAEAAVNGVYTCLSLIHI